MFIRHDFFLYPYLISNIFFFTLFIKRKKRKKEREIPIILVYFFKRGRKLGTLHNMKVLLVGKNALFRTRKYLDPFIDYPESVLTKPNKIATSHQVKFIG